MPLRWRGGAAVCGLTVDQGNASTSTGSMHRGQSRSQHDQCEGHQTGEQESRRWSERAQRASHHLGKVNVGEG
jgi:hypothetical protein